MSQSILFRMKRFAVAPALMFALLSFAAQAEYEAGVHYFELPTPIAVSGDGIEVTEYFSYGCNHCYQFEPILAAWVKTLPEDVTFNRTPAMWNQGYTLLAQTYYTLLAMDLLDTPAATLLREMEENGETYYRMAMRKAYEQREHFCTRPPSPETQAKYAQLAEQSMELMAEIEASDTLSFDEFLAQY